MDSAHEGTQPRGRGLDPSFEKHGNGFQVVDGVDVTEHGLRFHSSTTTKWIRRAVEAESGQAKDLRRCRVLVEFVDEGDL